MSKIINILKGYEEVKELVDGEISDYSYWEYDNIKWNDNYGDYDETDEEEHYKLEIKTRYDDKCKTLYFNYNTKTEKIEIELHEDAWFEIRSYDWTIKYFWMTLLKW